ncbi:hypothetical protein ACVIHI_009074 [Bradyrhizobium sp. USDA 4524]|uniref:hypothetical protein n=1 Tax=unclassified Bradyrhizobium TaxID=2631580 RepID=UPI00209D25F1|nr:MULTISPECIES: hypothetical protein [unclassified Bradyrhizobium]MCP1846147.1 hypothetical protein [Bradyrhizobium sp. USDA 4538]MCP1907218.1 hypothetical protein [Bradyrhizobium sp. USDA 4537]MCP1985694.1 hypothetical protein [Bradyrhizobium sp. USDA 4539]
MTQYNGVLLRQNLQDQGLLPRTGGWTASPDLIAAGTQPIQNPAAYYSSAGSMGKDLTQPVVINATNYFYLRGKNLGTKTVPAEGRIFFAPQSLFLYPQQWLNNGMKTAKGAEFSAISSIEPNAIGVTTDPLIWLAPNTSEHTCLIGFISTAGFPFASQRPPNAVHSLDDLAAWIGKNGGTGWHNVQFTSAGSPTFTNYTTYPASSKPAKVQFVITCLGCPVNSQVSFSCGTPLPDGTYINLPLTTVTKSDQFGVMLQYDIPAGWTSSVTYSYKDNGLPPGDNFSVSMSASIVETTPGGHAFSAFARPAAEVFPNHVALNPKTLAVTDMPVGLVLPVGSDMTKRP